MVAASFPVLHRHLSAAGVAGVLASAAGRAAGRVLSVRHLVPGVTGGVMVPLGTGEIAGHVFGHGLTPWVTLLAAGVFALVLDRRL